MRNKKTLMIVGLCFIAVMIAIAAFAPWIATHDPHAIALENRFQPPSLEHWFGTDDNGSDVFSKVVYGSRVSLSVAFSVVIVSTAIGLLVGSLAGYGGGRIDFLVMRVIDMIYAFPNFLLALALVAVLGPSLHNVILAMCVTGWAGYARLIRGEVLHLKEREYVLTAKSLGAPTPRVLVFHVWPNLTGPLVVQATFSLAGTIIAESGLSFLGLGVPPTTPTWGGLLSAGRKSLLEAPHMSFFPGLAILILVLGFNLFGDGLRDYLDPKKNRSS